MMRQVYGSDEKLEDFQVFYRYARFIQKLCDVGTIDNSIEEESFPARRRMG